MNQLDKSISENKILKFIKERTERVERGEYHTQRLIWEDFGTNNTIQHHYRGSNSDRITFSTGKVVYRHRHIKLDICEITHVFRYYKLKNKDMIFIPFSNSFIPFTRMNKQTKTQIHDKIYRFIRE
jgi:hypothetical protein